MQRDFVCEVPATPGMAGPRRLLRRILPLAAMACLAAPALPTARLSVLALPEGFIADNDTEAAVLCGIENGYPNNVYAVKGTFAGGDLPYYGLTYAPQTTLWASQVDPWSTSQMKVQTDDRGTWTGYIFVRLERTAPRGDVSFRFSAIPLSPISNPGPTVSEWCPTRALDPATTGGWLCGHVYRDPDCTVPASNIVVRATDAFGRVLSAYVCQNSYIPDGGDRRDTGAFRLGIPRGGVAALSGRIRVGKTDAPVDSPVALYVKHPGPWTVRAGVATSVDEPPWGDVDGDGLFRIEDAIRAAQIAAGFSESQETSAGDVWPDPPDGRITLEDAGALLRAVLLD